MDTQDNIINTEYAELYQRSLDATPEEVRDFLWSPTYSELLDVIVKKLELSEEQRNIVHEAVFNLLIDFFDQEDFEEEIAKLQLSEEKVDILLAYIDKYFIEPSVQEVQNTTANQSETEVVIKKAPSDHTDTELISTQYTPLFASLQAKMNMPTVVAPIVSVGQKFVPGPQHVPTSDIPKPAIDPYREMPL